MMNGSEQRRWSGIPSSPEQEYVRALEAEAPLAYTFVHQLPDGPGTWDIFHMSKLSCLAHCNRVSGPGADCET